MKEHAWTIITLSEAAKALKLMDAKACKTKFKNIRDTYMRHKKEHAAKQSRSGSGAVCMPDPSWPLWSWMQFLRYTVRHRQTASSIAIVENEVSNTCSDLYHHPHQCNRQTTLFCKVMMLFPLQ
eukprot:scpid103361/ scgid27447/ 